MSTNIYWLLLFEVIVLVMSAEVFSNTGSISLEKRLKENLRKLDAIENKTSDQRKETIETARTLDVVTGPVWKRLRMIGLALTAIENSEEQRTP